MLPSVNSGAAAAKFGDNTTKQHQHNESFHKYTFWVWVVYSKYFENSSPHALCAGAQLSMWETR